MTPQTITDITPNSAAVPLTTNPDLYATAVFLTGKGTTCRWGDANVGAARGSVLTNGQTVVLPRTAFSQGLWPLSKVYVYAEGSDSISISWA